MGDIIATGMPFHHVQQVDHTGNYGMVALMIGGNDLNNGCQEAQSCTEHLNIFSSCCHQL